MIRSTEPRSSSMRRMGDCQIGLAGAGRADAEDKLGALHGAHIGVLGGRAGDQTVFLRVEICARASLPCAQASAATSWSSAASAMRIAPSTSEALHAGALEQPVIEIIQRPAGLIGGDFLAAQVDRCCHGPGIEPSFCSIRARFWSNWPKSSLASRLLSKVSATYVASEAPDVGVGVCLGQVLSCQTPGSIIAAVFRKLGERPLVPVCVIRTLTMSPISPDFASTITG
jgi:hypothetical protein